MGRSRGLVAGDELGVRLGGQKSVAQFSRLPARYLLGREGAVSSFICSRRGARALYYGDGVAGTCVLLTLLFFSRGCGWK